MAEERKNERAGKFIVSSFGGESVRAYVPAPLPPTPSLRLDGIQVLLEQANQAGWAGAYVRKEAVLSSQIEGTQSSLSDLLLFENSEAPGGSGSTSVNGLGSTKQSAELQK